MKHIDTSKLPALSLRLQRRRLAATVLLGLISGVTAATGIIGWIGSERAIHPRATHYLRSLADFPDLQPLEIAFKSRTNVTIAGSFFRGSRTATILLSHGYGDNRQQMLPYAEFLHKAGFSVLTYDMRNRGHSEGDAVTLGALEPLDLVSAVDYLTTRPDVDHERIAALGVSLGASVTILAAAEDLRIKAIVDDSGFSDAPSVVGSSFEHFIGLPKFPFASVTVALAELRTGVSLRRVRPIDAVGRLSPRPLFIIHCTADRFIPPDHGTRIFARAKEPKQIWQIPVGGHIDGLVVASAEYKRRVVEFFNSALK